MRVNILKTLLAASVALLLAAPSMVGAAGGSDETSYIITADDQPLVIAGYRSVLRKDRSSEAAPERAAVEAGASTQPSRSSWYARRLDRIVPSGDATAEAATNATAHPRSGGACFALLGPVDRPWC